MQIVALILAAGSSRRMSGQNKLLLPYRHKTVIECVVEQFLAVPEITRVVVVTNQAAVRDKLASYPVTLVAGGDERYQSVYKGLEVLEDSDYVLIHDGARPFLPDDALARALACAREAVPFVLAVPVTDTLKQVADGFVVATPDRSDYWAAQTPQGARVSQLRAAYQQLRDQGLSVTDDASALEQAGYQVRVVMGDYANHKLTTPQDVRLLCVSDKE